MIKALLLFPFLSGFSQAKLPQINHLLNRIYHGELNHFFSKLELIEKNKSEKAVVVQIGDSHTQPDFISSVIRDSLQKRFGNGGRGVVFPYSLALSNSPVDIKSSSSVKWEYNRVAHPELGQNSGLSGFVIYSSDSSGDISMVIDRKKSYDSSMVRLYCENSGATSLYIKINDDSTKMLNAGSWINYPGVVQKVKISFKDNDSTFTFYGMNIENKRGGLVYHNIGVNGARYDQYNITPIFWKELASLNADLFIVSLGTNEAQKDSFNLSAFQHQLGLFVNYLHQASPNASVLITTTMDSYKRHKPNQTLKQINNAITDYCFRENIALWDLYKITNGLGSSRQWLRLGLMNKDKIHFLKDGYRLQGELLYKALMNEYARYREINIKTVDK